MLFKLGSFRFVLPRRVNSVYDCRICRSIINTVLSLLSAAAAADLIGDIQLIRRENVGDSVSCVRLAAKSGRC